jgi:hypothetical protein
MMHKDNFYYILKERLEYANEYLLDTSAFIKCVKFSSKVEKEFYKDKKILFFLNKLINLPINIYKYFHFLKDLINYQRAKNEIAVINKELEKYNDNNQNV